MGMQAQALAIGPFQPLAMTRQLGLGGVQAGRYGGQAGELPVFDNRDLRWSNELNDLGDIMDSETAVGRGYCDLSMIARPDARPDGCLDHVIKFKHLKLADLPTLETQALAKMPIDACPQRDETVTNLIPDRAV